VFIAPTIEGFAVCWGDRVLDRSWGWSGWGVVLLLVFQKDVKIPIREDMVNMVVGEVFCVYMKSFECVKVWAFSVVS
jgi:hypothetical protein